MLIFLPWNVIRSWKLFAKSYVFSVLTDWHEILFTALFLCFPFVLILFSRTLQPTQSLIRRRLIVNWVCFEQRYRNMQRFVKSPLVGAARHLSTKAAAAVPPVAAAISHLPPKKIPGIHGRYAGALFTAASKVWEYHFSQVPSNLSHLWFQSLLPFLFFYWQQSSRDNLTCALHDSGN